MKSLSQKRIALLAVVFSASVLTACTVSVTGGIGGIGASLLLAMILILTAGSQSGCSDDDDPDVGPCLSIEWDLGEDADIDMGEDVEIGPCLSPLPPDMGEDADMEEDIPVGPCLSMPPPDMGEDMDEDADMAQAPLT